MIILFLTTAFLNKWPDESLWVLAIMLMGPVWMMMREVFPNVLRNINTKYSLIHFLQKNLKKKDMEISNLKLEVFNLNQELSGMHKIWQQSKQSVNSTKKIEVTQEIKTEENHSPDELVELPYELSKRIFSQHSLKNHSILENKNQNDMGDKESNISV